MMPEAGWTCTRYWFSYSFDAESQEISAATFFGIWSKKYKIYKKIYGNKMAHVTASGPKCFPGIDAIFISRLPSLLEVARAYGGGGV